MKHVRDWAGATALSPLDSRSIIRAMARDAQMTFDQMTLDAAGNFLIGELERLDPTVNEPLANFTWTRDVDVREDVQMGDEVASYILSSFGSAGGVVPNGISWSGKAANTPPRLQLDLGKVSNPLRLWEEEISYTIPEMASAAQTGRPLDGMLQSGLQIKYNQDVDQVVYVGDTAVGATGLVNSSRVTNVANVVNGASASPLWANKTPQEQLNDVNAALTSAWSASGWSVAPTRLLLPPTQFGLISQNVISTAGNQSVLSYLAQNNITTAQTGAKIELLPAKWLVGAGAGGTDRMVAYTRDRQYVRMPIVPLQRTPIEYRSLYMITTYYGRVGQVEIRYPETFAYRDGI